MFGSMRRAAVALVSALLLAPPAIAQPADLGSRSVSASTAFFYGKDLPLELLAHYDRVVVEADHFASLPRSPRAELFAYVSVGEVHPTRSWRKEVPPRLVLGRNATWGSDVVDTSSAEWSAFLLDRVIEPLWARGYRGFFLDTLDSYERFVADVEGRARHARRIGALIAALERRHPDAKVILNRGFDVLPHARVDGFVVESLFSTCDASGRTCRPVPSTESETLLRRIRDVQARYHIPITVIDYAPSSDLEARRALAKRIAGLGFDPWVSTPKLDEIGVGRVEIVPRRVLLLYKSSSEGYLGVQDAAVLIAPVLEWLGYAVDYADVRQPLPAGKLVGRYAGIVTLLPDGVDASDAYRRWLLEQIAAGVRIAFIEGFGLAPDAQLLTKLGLAPAPSATAKAPMRIVKATEHFGFEAPPRPRLHERPPIVAARDDVRTLLRVADAEGAIWDGAVIGPWGGAAFLPYVIEERLEQERRWILNPFEFLKESLALPPIPAPDVTTEAGRRILTAHVDGDAFVSRAERLGSPFTAQIILEEVLERYRIPHTVSIVEGEVGPAGMYPEHTEKLEAFARRIFALPHVEVASHTYSHPFEWEDAEAGRRGALVPKLPHLPIPGYSFDLQRELAGSVAYIEGLAPKGKRVKVMLWSGSCSPSERAVAMTQRLGLYNVNGGGATRTRDVPSLTRGSAMGIPKGGGAYQVFAPIENENVYTNDWLGPFDGYRHAIETFELNDAPRRLSIISLYYHFYSAAKTASLRALEQVYAWALAQETTPLFLSEYAAKVLAFQNVSLARRLGTDTWEIGGLGELRTLRADPSLGWPDPSRSVGVAGVRQARQGRYVHLTDDREAGVAVVAFGSATPNGPRLVDANGRARRWRVHDGARASVRIEGNVPLELDVAAGAPCALAIAGRRITGTPQPSVAGGGRSVTRIRLSGTDTGEVDLECR